MNKMKVSKFFKISIYLEARLAISYTYVSKTSIIKIFLPSTERFQHSSGIETVCPSELAVTATSKRNSSTRQSRVERVESAIVYADAYIHTRANFHPGN